MRRPLVGYAIFPVTDGPKPLQTGPANFPVVRMAAPSFYPRRGKNATPRKIAQEAPGRGWGAIGVARNFCNALCNGFFWQHGPIHPTGTPLAGRASPWQGGFTPSTASPSHPRTTVRVMAVPAPRHSATHRRVSPGHRCMGAA